MKVRLSVEALEDPAVWEQLDEIVRLIREGRHRWLVGDIDDVVAIEDSQWFTSEPDSRATRRNRDTLEKAVTARAYVAPPAPGEARRCHTLDITVGGPGGIAASEASKALGTPAYLVLENANDSDNFFVNAIVHAYRRDELAEALREGWLVLDHAGGKGEIRKRVLYLKGLAPVLARIQVLADSDRLLPGHDSDMMRLAHTWTTELGVIVHLLHKREAENYLPFAALADRSRGRKRRELYPEFISLTSEQQDHYDMKQGFRADKSGQPQIPPSQRDLYQNLSPSQVQKLGRGFGKHAIKWFWPQDDSAPYYATRECFEARCESRPGELAAILDQIEAMI